MVKKQIPFLSLSLLTETDKETPLARMLDEQKKRGSTLKFFISFNLSNLIKIEYFFFFQSILKGE